MMNINNEDHIEIGTQRREEDIKKKLEEIEQKEKEKKESEKKLKKQNRR